MDSLSAPLTQQEANELASAWLQRLAEGLAVRSLIIKGRSLAHHGLREPRLSADIDVLVEPRRFDDFCRAIAAAGWRERDIGFLAGRLPSHSKTFVHADWPTDLDVHAQFPGFLSPPADVFEALWQHREQILCAHVECMTLDRVGSILVLGLHSVRSARSQVRHDRELQRLLRIQLNQTDRSAITDLARRTGCVRTLGPVLFQLGVHADPGPHEYAPGALEDWRRRTALSRGRLVFWWSILREARWPEKPVVIRRAVWPSRDDLLRSRPDVVDTAYGRLRGRVGRLARGIHSSLRASTAARRRARDDTRA